MTIIVRVPWRFGYDLSAVYRALDSLGLVVTDSQVLAYDYEGHCTIESWFLDHSKMVLDAA